MSSGVWQGISTAWKVLSKILKFDQLRSLQVDTAHFKTVVISEGEGDIQPIYLAEEKLGLSMAKGRDPPAPAHPASERAFHSDLGRICIYIVSSWPFLLY